MARQSNLTVGQLLTSLRQRRDRLASMLADIDAELGEDGHGTFNGFTGGGKAKGGRGGGGKGKRKGGSASKGALLSAIKNSSGGLTKAELKEAVPGADLRALRFEPAVKKK